WERITLSRTTAFYFVFSVLHFIVQVVFQIQAFAINASAAKFLSNIVADGGATAQGFMVYDQDLRMCNTVPSTISTESCTIVWNGNTTASMMAQLGNNVANSSASGPLRNSTNTAATVQVSAPSTSAVNGAFANPSVSSSVSNTPPSSSSLAASSHPSVASSSHPASVLGSALPRVSAQSHDTVTSTHLVTVTVQPSATQAAKLFVETVADVVDGDSDQAQNDIFAATSQPIQANGENAVQVNGLPGGPVALNHSCLNVLNWPVQELDNTKREDIAFIMFQLWLLGMSLVALLNESIPHIVASLLTHMVATAWGGFQIFNTSQFHHQFNMLTIGGACGVNLLPRYWTQRSNAEIPSLALNSVALLCSAVLSWRLMKSFGWQTFKRVGASRTINRVYNVVLLLSISIQLTLFFIAVTGALWIDQLYHGAIGHLATQSTIFKAITIVVLVLLIPWLTLGWISVRREYTFPMLFFLSLSLLYMAGWASFFSSPTFRWTFIQWRFFDLVATASVLLTLVTFVLGVVCRINFGKGLTRYLNAQEPIPDETFFPRPIDSKVDGDIEKAAFPSNDLPIPTFSVAFGSGSEVPPPSQMRFGPRQLGPRFYDRSLDPFDPQPTSGRPVSPSPSTFSHSTASTGSLSRGGSQSSQKSGTSETSFASHSKRWVIE
ncbi:hypothetical protein B0H21DRAFT_851085, partial [Amylocystis lapponica]